MSSRHLSYCARSTRPLRLGLAATVERLEARAFKSVNTWTDTSLTDLSSYAYSGVLQCGDDSTTTGGDPELETETYSAVQNMGQNMWDPNLSDGLDSGLVTATMDFSVGSGTNQGTWSVGSQSLAVSGSSLSHVSQVAILADVQASDSTMAWSNITVSFYSGNTLLQSFSIASLSASNDASTTGTAESGAVVTTDYSNADRVVISASARLTSGNAGLMPSDIFGQVAIT